jgi:predicted sulfurtransferase
MLFLATNKYFNDLEDEIRIKTTHVDGHQFEKMIVRYRSEIVAL